MSTTSYSVLNDMLGAFESPNNWEINRDSIRVSKQVARAELEYDHKNYDVTVTKLCPNCGEKMDFGQAIRCLKAGMQVSREGWNGKGMYLWLLPAAEIKKEWCRDAKLLEAFGDRDTLTCLGSIRMYTADGKVLTGWLASQTDMLAEDWIVVGW